MELIHDGNLTLSIGTSVTAREWVKTDMTWSSLVARLSTPVVTWETKAQYHMSLPKVKTKAKDVGGYVGGILQGTTRGKNSVLSRQLISLDLDGCTNVAATWGLFQLVFGCAACIHTTHSHLPEDPRARLIIPLAQNVSPKNYTRISEHIANRLGLSMFDPTTHEPNRLMFWPSVSSDGVSDYIFEHLDAPWLDGMSLLKDQDTQALLLELSKDDPGALPGVVGQFNKAFPVSEAIDKFIPEVYVRVSPGRYRLADADSTGGMVLYGDDKYCYSHHAKDPIQGKLTHAYDLIRTHKFGGDSSAMQEWIIESKFFDTAAIELTLNKKGMPEPTIGNMRRILNQDPEVANAVVLDEFAGKLMVYGDFPWLGLMDRSTFMWTDTDDAGLREFFESKYGMIDRFKLQDALALTASDNKIHPVRKYLTGIVWDGKTRADTLFIDFLRADDTPYVRSVTRKALIGAVARIMEPGCKHDHVLVLVGPQGCRKSTTINKLGGKWYTDSLYTMQGKEAYELVQGYWIIEMSEMAATRKADIEAIKQFITKQSDNFRAAYDRRTIDHPRQCAFFGSTNDEEFLRDYTGNRRFWPVGVRAVPEDKYAELTDDYIRQVWAEMVAAYRAGETWYLDEVQEAAARQIQEEHLAASPMAGTVLEFINDKIPANWGETRLPQRRQMYGMDAVPREVVRDRVCALEIWVECLNGSIKDFTPVKSREINQIIKRTKKWKERTMRFIPDYGIQRGFERI
jgi:predicted P-loop ATPase